MFRVKIFVNFSQQGVEGIHRFGFCPLGRCYLSSQQAASLQNRQYQQVRKDGVRGVQELKNASGDDDRPFGSEQHKTAVTYREIDPTCQEGNGFSRLTTTYPFRVARDRTDPARQVLDGHQANSSEFDGTT